MSTAVFFLAAFLASAVEMVEALTIVLALALVRGRRSPLLGAAAAVGALALLIAALGPALRSLPIDALQLVVGALLLTFGLQWLRKAILRASGYVPVHDEQEAFRAVSDRALAAAGNDRAGMDWYSFTLAFKGVLLEGLEVAFIVLTFGTTEGRLWLTAGAAGAALVVVAVVGAIVHAPLSRVPENTIKFAVGLLLTTFGAFWSTEGAGADWPAGEFALVGLFALLAATSWASVRVLRRQRLALQLSDSGP
jgi:uncharacterized membrane protein